jgi:hypothetical protein
MVFPRTLWRVALYDDDDEDDNDEGYGTEPPVSWPDRYLAELAPAAENDYLVMDPNPTKQALFDLFNGADPADVVSEFPDVDIEDLADPSEGWSFLRVGGYVVPYRRLTSTERHQLGRNADILVSRIKKVQP